MNRAATIDDVLRAMRADAVPAAARGLWAITKPVITERSQKILAKMGKSVDPLGPYTLLARLSLAGLHTGRLETVMNDLRSELQTHLNFVLRARGRVLVTGLGLGCVVRGLLAVGAAESVDVVERDRDVVALCGPSVADPRVRVHQMDALERLPEGRWDYAWHDLWQDEEAGDPRLRIMHLTVMGELRRRVRYQAAWAYRNRGFARKMGWRIRGKINLPRAEAGLVASGRDG